MKSQFQDLPKIELHLHLDCSLSHEVAARLRPGTSREDYERLFIAPADSHGLPDYLARALEGIALMQTAENLRAVTLDLFDQLKADNILYAEIRFAPLEHCQQGLTPEEVVDLVDRAVGEASASTGVEARLILCTLRHYSEAQGMETVRLVDQFRDRYVAGFDIAADEAAFPVGPHVAAFRYARERGIPCTAHAGEACGPESVWETLEFFQPQRIGHGVRSIEDPRLVAHLKETRIHLEVCPSSNLMTRVFPSMPDHSVDKLFQAGLSVGINTDGRAISNVSLSEEYDKLHQTFGWGVAHFLQCNLNALQAAFLPNDKKAALRARLEAGY